MTGQELRDARAQLELSQPQLASVLGITENTISRWENGHRPIPPYLHLAIAALMPLETSS